MVICDDVSPENVGVRSDLVAGVAHETNSTVTRRQNERRVDLFQVICLPLY
jgi:hypothetical protein